MIPRLTAGLEVRIEKVDTKPGRENSYGINEGYWIEGRLLADIETKSPIQVARTSRNGISKLGLFTTSVVTGYVDKGPDHPIEVHTQNSTYLVEEKRNLQ